MNRDARGLAKRAGQRAGTHAHHVGQRFEGCPGRQVVRQPVLRVVNAGVHVAAVIEVEAVLAVLRPAAGIDDQPARDLGGKARAVRFFEQVQGQVDAGGDPRAGVEAAVFDKERIALRPHPGVARLQFGQAPPVGGAFAAVEQAGLGQHERAGADGTETGALRLLGPEPGKKGLPFRPKGGGAQVVHLQARDDNKVPRFNRHFRKGKQGTQAQAGRAHDRFLVGTILKPVGLALKNGFLEYLHRASQVQ